MNPPDTNGDVGVSQYVQIVNSPKGAAFAVYNKAGALLSGPTELSSLWTGGACSTNGQGDPIAQYDQYADRWVLAQFAFGTTSAGGEVGPFHECIAVSKTGDATGDYWLTDFTISNTLFPDFPKFGVWPGDPSTGNNNAYYMTVHLFDPSTGGYVGQAIIAFERAKMINGAEGQTVAQQGFVSSTNSLFGAMPADAQGSTPPPAGAPEYLAAVKDGGISGGPDRLDLYGLFVDWKNENNTFAGGPLSLDVSSFDANLCNGGACIPQKDMTSTHDWLNPVTTTPVGTPVSYPLVYRNFDSFDSLALADTVDVGGDRAGIRWYEIQSPGTRPEISRFGTVGAADDGLHRFMGSISIDKGGELGLGYSISGPSMFPGIRYAGPLSASTDGATSESVLMNGAGSQMAGGNRWGDYSSMSVDPTDGCTFFYTNEYYATTAQGGLWNTRIGSFKFPTCDAATPAGPGNDTTPPHVINAYASPKTFTPLAHKHKATFINWESSEAVLPQVRITSVKTGKLVARFSGGATYELPYENWYVKWTGIAGGRVLPAGTYRWTISATDAAGNHSPSVSGTVVLKR